MGKTVLKKWLVKAGLDRSTRIGLVVLSIVTFIGSLTLVSNLLMFDSLALSDGEVWRPFTAWFSQLNIRHWFLNQWGLVIMAILLPTRLPKIDLFGLILIWVSASLLLWFSNYTRYVGLSGVLYGLLVYSAAISPFYAKWIRVMFIVCLCIKVFGENGLIPSVSSDWVAQFIQGEIAFESHLWGLLSGLIMIALRRFFREFP